jgi:hypothetical protein
MELITIDEARSICAKSKERQLEICSAVNDAIMNASKEGKTSCSLLAVMMLPEEIEWLTKHVTSYGYQVKNLIIYWNF